MTLFWILLPSQIAMGGATGFIVSNNRRAAVLILLCPGGRDREEQPS